MDERRGGGGLWILAGPIRGRVTADRRENAGQEARNGALVIAGEDRHEGPVCGSLGRLITRQPVSPAILHASVAPTPRTEYSHAATQNFVFRRYFIVSPTRTSSRTSFLTLYSNLRGKKLTKLIFTDEETKNRGYLWFLFCISFEDDYSSIDRLKRGFLFSRWKDNFFALHQLGNILARFF